MVQAGELMTDYDKLIDRQLERASISAVTGFLLQNFQRRVQEADVPNISNKAMGKPFRLP